MTIGLTNSYTTVAVIPEFPASGRVTNAAVGLYTCPANRKAKVSATMLLDAAGADAIYAIAIKRGAIYVPFGNFVFPVTDTDVADYTSHGTAIMEAGDILTNIGDAGSTNGTADIDAMIQEIEV